MFEKIKNNVNFSMQEESVLTFWKENAIFERSLEKSKGKPYYSFYDGPPFATGLPHYGHLLTSTIKDVVPRYYTMRGHHVPRRFGWDCHGLPIEMLIQEELGLKTSKDILSYGVDKFNDRCRQSVLKYYGEWEKTLSRLGRWVDFKEGYKTMDTSFMESVWWVFKQLFDKGLIYKGYKVLPYSWKAGTSLSNFEANSNYKDVQDPAITVQFPLCDEENTYFLAWTTTPWTLVSNLSLCVKEDMDYVKVQDTQQGCFYYLGKKRLESLLGSPEKLEKIAVLKEMKGRELVGKRYQPLFRYIDSLCDTQNAYRVVSDDFVSDEEGTGIVHMAPNGEDDYRILTIHNIPIADLVDDAGSFIDSVTLFKGKNIKEADKDIIKHLKEKGLLFKHETLQHSYPFCWRTDTPLIYKPISTWFVKVEKLREAMVENNQRIHWVPEHIKGGRFGKWLENARDWDIARNRYWGTPLPIWENEEGDVMVFGSIEELEKACGQKITDLHKEYVDALVLTKHGKTYKRVSSVLDCWFESGSMPYAQHHYPFENKSLVEDIFPADFIVEGLDQTRGWFYTLIVLSTALKESNPFKNVIVNGLILAEDGKKMSKKLKNYPDPSHIIDLYGSDALRMYLISSSVVKAEYLRFSENGVKEVLKSILIPLWNSLSFFTNYANIDQWSPERLYSSEELTHALDRWIISYTQKLCTEVVGAMDRYDLQNAVPPIVTFIEKLTNWYIRRSRRRFWKNQNDEDKKQAYSTLYTVLLTLSKLTAPFMPFISERIYKVLTFSKAEESVHMESFPLGDPSQRDLALEDRMEWIQNVVEQGRAIRSHEKIKVRQPLKKMIVLCKDKAKIQCFKDNLDIILEELNVKEVVFSENEEEYLHITINPNFQALREHHPEKLKEAIQVIRTLSAEDVCEFLEKGQLTKQIGHETLVLSENDVLLVRKEKEGRPISSEGDVSIVMETQLDETLKIEGFGRDFVNLVQKKRKDLDLEYTDRIAITYLETPLMSKMLEQHEAYVKEETLCLRLKATADSEGMEAFSIDDTLSLSFRVEKIEL